MNNFDTVREALELATPHYQADTARFAAALKALAAIEADHYSAADMADAQAKAFREGVASVTAGQEPVAWLVCSVNSDGSLSLEYAAAWKEGAHEHINDAITEHGVEEAASWVVRPAYVAAPVAQQPPKLEDIEQYRMQMAGICTAATGYWKESDSIHPNYDTPALREVAKLYAKYDALYKAQQPQAEAVPSDVVRDAERLDWLIDGAGRRIAIDSFGGQYRIVDPTASLVLTDWYSSKREAIDAAMAQGEKP